MSSRFRTAALVGVAAFFVSFLLRYWLSKHGQYDDDVLWMSIYSGIAGGTAAAVQFFRRRTT